MRIGGGDRVRFEDDEGTMREGIVAKVLSDPGHPDPVLLIAPPEEWLPAVRRMSHLVTLVSKLGQPGESEIRDHDARRKFVPKEDQLREIEQKYRITLTDGERMLLTTPTDLLSPVERQQRYLLGKDLAPLQCPACLSVICRLSALRDGREDIGGHHPDEDHWCPRCEARLVWHLPLMGDSFFTIHPSEARPVKS